MAVLAVALVAVAVASLVMLVVPVVMGLFKLARRSVAHREQGSQPSSSHSAPPWAIVFSLVDLTVRVGPRPAQRCPRPCLPSEWCYRRCRRQEWSSGSSARSR
jgi:hypothetical protein